MGFETLRIEKQDRVATLTLNRPERHNAFNLAMARELAAFWTDVKSDPEVVCTIVTGAGDKAFCTGMDIGDVADGSARSTGMLARARELAGKIAEHSPAALARSKQAIWESLDVGLDEALSRTWKLINEHTSHADLQEGSRAFVEKRRPRWAPYTED